MLGITIVDDLITGYSLDGTQTTYRLSHLTTGAQSASISTGKVIIEEETMNDASGEAMEESDDEEQGETDSDTILLYSVGLSCNKLYRFMVYR